MQTLHPEAWVISWVLCEFDSKNALLGRYGKRRREVQILDQFFEGFLAYGLLFELFKILQKERQMRF